MLVIFSTIRLFFPPFNDDLGTMPTRRPHSWKKNFLPAGWPEHVQLCGSSPFRRPGTARWSVHLPCTDELQFVAAVVAGALCGMPLAGVAACESRANPIHSRRHLSETVGRKQRMSSPVLPHPHKGEVCLRLIFRACSRDQLEVDFTTVLVGRRCRVGGGPTRFA